MQHISFSTWEDISWVHLVLFLMDILALCVVYVKFEKILKYFPRKEMMQHGPSICKSNEVIEAKGSKKEYIHAPIETPSEMKTPITDMDKIGNVEIELGTKEAKSDEKKVESKDVQNEERESEKVMGRGSAKSMHLTATARKQNDSTKTDDNKRQLSKKHKSKRKKQIKKSRSARNTLKLQGNDGGGGDGGDPSQHGNSQQQGRRHSTKTFEKSSTKKKEKENERENEMENESRKNDQHSLARNLSALDENKESKPSDNVANALKIGSSIVSSHGFSVSEVESDASSQDGNRNDDLKLLTSKTHDQLIQRSATDRINKSENKHHKHGTRSRTKTATNANHKKPKLAKAVSEIQNNKSLPVNLVNGNNNNTNNASKNVKELLGQIEVQMPSTWYSHRNQESFDFYEKLFNPESLVSESETEQKMNAIGDMSQSQLHSKNRSSNSHHNNNNNTTITNSMSNQNHQHHVSNSGSNRRTSKISRISLKNVFSLKKDSDSNVISGTGASSGNNGGVTGASNMNSIGNNGLSNVIGYNAMTNNNFGVNFNLSAFGGASGPSGLSRVNNESNSVITGGIGGVNAFGARNLSTIAGSVNDENDETTVSLKGTGGNTSGNGMHGGKRLQRGDSKLIDVIKSKIHEESAAKRRYRYILYFPVFIHCVFGLISVTVNDWQFMIYGYPLIEFILGLTLWCYVDIIILSCGGAHIVQESLEVQISADDSYYRCIYCYCCPCCHCFGFNCFSFDNSHSLHRCHLALLKIILCVIAPLLLVCIGIVSEVSTLRDELQSISLNELINVGLSQDVTVYWLILIVLLALNVFCVITAAIISIQVAHSLHHISSLNVDSLIWKYCSVFVLSCIISIQFAVIILSSTFLSDECSPTKDETLCISLPFHMILVYFELFIATCVNYVAFKNDDFEFWGKKVIPQINIYAYEHVITFDKIHDLYNYRQVQGADFLWEWEHPNNTPRQSIVAISNQVNEEQELSMPQSESDYSEEDSSDNESDDGESETQSETKSDSDSDWGEESESDDKKKAQSKKKKHQSSGKKKSNRKSTAKEKENGKANASEKQSEKKAENVLQELYRFDSGIAP